MNLPILNRDCDKCGKEASILNDCGEYLCNECDKPYKCENCEERFQSGKKMFEHMRTTDHKISYQMKGSRI